MEDLGDAHLYARKSSYRGRQKGRHRSVREQLELGDQWATSRDVRVASKYIDDGRSASRFATEEREEFERLMTDLEAGRIPRGDVVVAFESSRLHRDLAVYVQLRDACWKAGVRWCINGRLFDLADRHDRRASAYEAIQNEDEAEEISERVKRALLSNAVLGRPHANPLYGYERIYDPRTGDLSAVILDAQAPVVAEIFGRVRERESMRGILRDLRARRLPSPSQAAIDDALGIDLTSVRVVAALSVEEAADAMGWSARRLTRIEAGTWRIRGDDLDRLLRVYAATDEERQRITGYWAGLPQWTVPAQINQIIRNPAYMGRRVHQGEDIGDAMWPPIVDEGTWRAANLVLKDPARLKQRDNSVKHLLAGIATCAVCNAPARTGRHQRKKYPIYRCERGGHFATAKDAVEGYVVLTLSRRLARKDAAVLFGTARSDDTEAKHLTGELTRWRADLEEGEQLVESGQMTMMRLARLEQRLAPKIEAAETRLGRLRTDPLVARLIKPTPALVLHEWQKLDIAQQRAFLRATAIVRICPVGKGRRNVPVSEYVKVTWRKPG